jgi:small glutamine-rich tetratricopeptide repeat-containing protein alpha
MGGLADTLRNMGGAGAGAGGMPDLASLMNNPAMMQMAQQMMANGGLERLMSNPAVANMVSYIDRVTPLCSCLTYACAPCAFTRWTE